jgi:hypothetical protein
VPSFKRSPPREAILRLPVTFQVGSHVLRIVHVAEGRWTVSVDGGPPSQPFPTQTEAWEAGVRISDQQDRRPPP